MSRGTEKSVENHSKTKDWVHPIQRQSLGDQAYEVIRHALMRGQLKPGERMRLRQMSERFGISLTPTREALLRLVHQGALVMDSRGTVVVPELTKDELLEIRSIRLSLEGNAAAAAAKISNTDDIELLEEIQNKIEECHAKGKYEVAVDTNTEFHLSLCRAGRQPITYDIVESMWVRCGPILSHLYDAGIPHIWDSHPHNRVIDALKRGDSQAAREAIKYDIMSGGEELFKYVRETES